MLKPYKYCRISLVFIRTLIYISFLQNFQVPWSKLLMNYCILIFHKQTVKLNIKRSRSRRWRGRVAVEVCIQVVILHQRCTIHFFRWTPKKEVVKIEVFAKNEAVQAAASTPASAATAEAEVKDESAAMKKEVNVGKWKTWFWRSLTFSKHSNNINRSHPNRL